MKTKLLAALHVLLSVVSGTAWSLISALVGVTVINSIAYFFVPFGNLMLNDPIDWIIISVIAGLGAIPMTVLSYYRIENIYTWKSETT